MTLTPPSPGKKTLSNGAATGAEKSNSNILMDGEQMKVEIDQHHLTDVQFRLGAMRDIASNYLIGCGDVEIRDQFLQEIAAAELSLNTALL